MSMSNIEITELEKMRRMLESASILLSDTAYSDEHPYLPTSKRALFLLPKENAKKLRRPFFPVEWWLMFVMISQRLTDGVRQHLTDGVQNSRKMTLLICKRIFRGRLMKNPNFPAEIAFHMGKLNDARILFGISCDFSHHESPYVNRPSLICAYLCAIPLDGGELSSHPDAAFYILMECYLCPFLRGQKKMSRNDWRFFLRILQMLVENHKETAKCIVDSFLYTDECCDCFVSDPGFSCGIPRLSDEMNIFQENSVFLQEIDSFIEHLNRMIHGFPTDDYYTDRKEK